VKLNDLGKKISLDKMINPVYTHIRKRRPTMDRAYKRACDAIDAHDPVCDQVATEYGVVFEQVKNMHWFILEVAERLG
jgi:hypothetical protein